MKNVCEMYYEHLKASESVFKKHYGIVVRKPKVTS